MPRFTWIVPTISPYVSCTSRTLITPPIALITSSSAARVGFIPSASSTRFESSNSREAHRKKAAEDISPGTVASMALSFCPPTIESRSPLRSSLAPNARSACSEWSRVRTCSAIDVVPLACNPANSTAVFTCALAIGVSKSIAVSGVPLTVIGAWPSVSSMRAPICSKGFRIRSIGRTVSDSSPTKRYRPACAATKPASMRIVEPELPQSRLPTGCASTPAVPVTSIVRPTVSTFAPIACMQPSELCGSSPVEKFISRDVPSANPASMA